MFFDPHHCGSRHDIPPGQLRCTTREAPSSP
jgi:hypothetical protein